MENQETTGNEMLDAMMGKMATLEACSGIPCSTSWQNGFEHGWKAHVDTPGQTKMVRVDQLQLGDFIEYQGGSMEVVVGLRVLDSSIETRTSGKDGSTCVCERRPEDCVKSMRPVPASA